MPKRTALPKARDPLPLLTAYPGRRRWLATVAVEAAVVVLFIAFVLVALGVVFGHG